MRLRDSRKTLAAPNEMGKKSVELLLQQMADGDAADPLDPMPQTVVLPTRLRVRETTPATSSLTA